MLPRRIIQIGVDEINVTIQILAPYNYWFFVILYYEVVSDALLIGHFTGIWTEYPSREYPTKMLGNYDAGYSGHDDHYTQLISKWYYDAYRGCEQLVISWLWALRGMIYDA